ncbi:hypothetical protein ACMG4J_22510 [Rossellomorea marisflavi]|uniref:hypothetical protein n=1 Tax=Rossellomorea marisflavi TaxID=189381 RepID=UPI0039BFAFDF
MGVKIRGLKALEAKLEDILGPTKTRRITDMALKAAGEEFKRTLQRDFASFKDTGASIREMTLTEPYTYNGKRTVTIKWKGPDNRYSIIHLNEFGTIRNPNPRGKGVIAAAMKNSEKAYRDTIARIYKGAFR